MMNVFQFKRVEKRTNIVYHASANNGNVLMCVGANRPVGYFSSQSFHLST